MYAVRHIEYCTKDCLCLYVCPTGATDTENGQVDASKCIGCGACAKACPSLAITMHEEGETPTRPQDLGGTPTIPTEYPPQQLKTNQVRNVLIALAKSKTEQEKIALEIAEMTEDAILNQLALAVAKSNRIMAEDIIREAGYMIPQSANVNKLLKSLLESDNDIFLQSTVKKILESIQSNEE